MSLRIWLPLTNDLRNQGSANASVTNMSAAINANGKLGKCYSFGTGKSYLKFNDVNFMHNMTECSVSLWLKILTWNTSYATYFQFGLGSTPWAHYIFGLLRNNANSTLCFTISDGTNATNANCLTPTITLNEWYHLTFTYSSGHCKIYVNGAETKDYTTTIVPNFAGITTGIIGACNNGNNYQTNCLMNDFRVYDHCLSPEEVREIANGLVLHYKLDASNENLLKDVPKAHVATDYCSYQLNLKQNLTTGQAYTLQLWDVLVEHSAKTAAQMNLAVYWGGGNVQLIRFNQSAFEETRDHYAYASHLSITFTPTSTQASGSDAANAWFNLYNSVTNASGTRNMKIEAWKLEKGSEATPWISSDGDLTTVVDSSGFNNNTEDTNNINTTSDTNRYLSASTCESLYMDKLKNRDFNNTTFNIWFKLSASSADAVIMFGNVNIALWPPNKYIVRDWTLDSFEHNKKFNINEWYMFTIIFTSRTITTYINAQLIAQDTFSGDLSFSGPVGIENMNNIYISDIRFYATPLLDSEIKKLYNINMGMDNKNQIHTYEFNEFAAAPQLHKTGVLDGLINEFPYCPYDPQIYIEPDGSAWIRIYHHNNPAAAVFASSDSFTTSVYKDEDRWFYVSLCNLVDKWELMVKTKYTPTSTELKRRWVQTVNPMTATFAQVAAANIIENTTTGYSHISWGGLYHIGSNTYLCTNSGTNGNWWGAVGAWSQYQGGIPGWLGIVTKTGYNDLYLRVDNVNFTNTMLHNDINWLTNGAIER